MENAMTLNDLQDYIHQLAQEWVDLKQWEQPTELEAVAFMVTEAAEALSDALSAANSSFVRNNPDKDRSWAKVDVEVADTIIMALRYFAARGMPAEAAVLSKIKKMDEKRRNAATNV